MTKKYQKKRIYICDNCPKTDQYKTEKKSHYDRHLCRHHRDIETVVEYLREQNFTECEKCGQEFIDKQDATTHVARCRNAGAWKCDKCDLVFDTYGKKNYHDRKFHPTRKQKKLNKKFICPGCKIQYSSKQNMLKHYEGGLCEGTSTQESKSDQTASLDSQILSNKN